MAQAAAPTPTIPPAQQQLNTSLVQQNAALQQQIAQLQAQINQPVRMRELRLPEPKQYSGSKDKLQIREWLRAMEEIFTLGMIPLNHPTTITYAAHYLASEAKTWYKMHELNIQTWQQFKTIMVERYKDPREVDKLRQKLASVRQITTVDGYTVAFDKTTLELTEAAGYAPREEELVFMYREGLKPQIKTLLVARGPITILKPLQETALEIDAALYNTRGTSGPSGYPHGRPVGHRAPGNHSSGHNRFKSDQNSQRFSANNRFGSNRFQQFNRHKPFQSFSRPFTPSRPDNRGYAPMDTSNAIRQEKREQIQAMDNRKKTSKPATGNCFNCGKAGHYARDCRSAKPATNQQRHNNIMQEEIGTEPDTVLIIAEINSTQAHKPNKRLITFMGMVHNHPAYVLVDSGATNNYISESFVTKHQLYTEPIGEATEAILANGTSLNVTRMVPSIPIRIQEYSDVVDANVLALDKYEPCAQHAMA
jgi:hypothetical protein